MLLNTTDLMNQELIVYSKAQMESARLYIPSYKPQTERTNDDIQLIPAFMGVRALKNQLLRIQGVATPLARSVRYVMPGDQKKAENQKDMLMAFLYACYGLREIHRATTKYASHVVPVAYGTVVHLTRNFGRR
jgi:hypothetical protein